MRAWMEDCGDSGELGCCQYDHHNHGPAYLGCISHTAQHNNLHAGGCKSPPGHPTPPQQLPPQQQQQQHWCGDTGHNQPQCCHHIIINHCPVQWCPPVPHVPVTCTCCAARAGASGGDQTRNVELPSPAQHHVTASQGRVSVCV